MSARYVSCRSEHSRRFAWPCGEACRAREPLPTLPRTPTVYQVPVSVSGTRIYTGHFAINRKQAIIPASTSSKVTHPKKITLRSLGGAILPPFSTASSTAFYTAVLLLCVLVRYHTTAGCFYTRYLFQPQYQTVVSTR